MSAEFGRRRFLRGLGMAAGAALTPSTAAAASSRPPTPHDHVNVVDHGARGDGRHDNRHAFQEAIDFCAERGGGTVYVPAGRFVTGSVRLRSHVRLLLDSGAVVAGSSEPEAYEHRSLLPHTPGDGWGSALILAEACEHVTVEGAGTITGGGLALTPSGERGPFRPRLIAFERCRHVRVQDLTLLHSDRWTLHLYQCDHARVRGLGIYAGLHVLNTDGIDVDGCENVVISDCDIAVGDDCVCIKTTDYLGPPRPCRNVTVTNCVVATRSSGLKIGTETHADVENVAFSNCVVYSRDAVEPHTGVGLMTVDGANLSGISVTGITMRGVVAPLFLRLGNRGTRQLDPVPGTLNDVVIQNVVATGASLASSITGIPGHPVEHVSISNVRVQFRGGGSPDLARLDVPERITDYPRSVMFGELPAQGLFVRHARDVSLHDLHVRATAADQRPVLHAEDVQQLQVTAFGSPSSDGARVRLRDVREVHMPDVPADAVDRSGPG